MTEKQKYDSTVARIAGNIASGWVNHDQLICRRRNGEIRREMLAVTANDIAEAAVMVARFIVAEVERTEAPPVRHYDNMTSCSCSIIARNINCPFHGGILENLNVNGVAAQAGHPTDPDGR